MKFQKPQIWVISADYFRAKPVRDYLRKLNPTAEVTLYRVDEHFKGWLKDGFYPHLIVSDGTCKRRDEGAFEDFKYDPLEDFARQYDIPVEPMGTIEEALREKDR